MADPAIDFGIDLETIRARVDELTGFNSTGDIQTASQVVDGSLGFVPPAAFVSIANEGFGPNAYSSGGFRQRSTVLISVLYCIPVERIDGELTDQVDEFKKLVLAQLAGWTPGGAEKALEAYRYSIRLNENGFVWPEWLFRTSYQFIK